MDCAIELSLDLVVCWIYFQTKSLFELTLNLAENSNNLWIILYKIKYLIVLAEYLYPMVTSKEQFRDKNNIALFVIYEQIITI